MSINPEGQSGEVRKSSLINNRSADRKYAGESENLEHLKSTFQNVLPSQQWLDFQTSSQTDDSKCQEISNQMNSLVLHERSQHAGNCCCNQLQYIQKVKGAEIMMETLPADNGYQNQKELYDAIGEMLGDVMQAERQNKMKFTGSFLTRK